MAKLIFVDQIDLTHSPMVRAEIRDDVVHEYWQVYSDNHQHMPALHVFQSEGQKKVLLADGRHRLEAAKRAGKKAVECEVHVGTFDDALTFALLANSQHGLRRSNEDKRASIKLAMTAWPQTSDRQLAGLCAVGHQLVGEVRIELEKEKVIPKETHVTTSDGKRHPRADGFSAESENGKDKPKTHATPASNKVLLLDKTGYKIPDTCLSFWNRSTEVQELISDLRRVKHALKQGMEKKDLMFAELTNTCLADLDKAIYSTSLALPFAVCPYCQGHPELQPQKHCRTCLGRGVISEYRWQLIPKELKELRKAV